MLFKLSRPKPFAIIDFLSPKRNIKDICDINILSDFVFFLKRKYLFFASFLIEIWVNRSILKVKFWHCKKIKYIKLGFM